jgi:hypothetical protein
MGVLLQPATAMAAAVAPAPAKNDRRETAFLIKSSILFTGYLSSVQVGNCTFSFGDVEERYLDLDVWVKNGRV